MIVFCNGRFVSDRRASISIYDHGFLYGDGVYETIRVYGGRPFLLREHLQRLNHSLLGIQLAPPISLIDLGRIVQKVVEVNNHRDAVARLILTRGPGPFGFDPRLCLKPTVVVTSTPMSRSVTQRWRSGIRAAVVSVRRNHPAALPPEMKSTSCLNNVLAKMESLSLGAREGIFLTHDNWIAEGTVSNIFLVRRGILRTPRLEGTVLPGVTRSWVLALARESGIPIEEDRLGLPQLVSADEVFLTSTIMEIAPVRRIIYNLTSRPREFPVGSGRVGPVTQLLLKKFRSSVRASRSG